MSFKVLWRTIARFHWQNREQFRGAWGNFPAIVRPARQPRTLAAISTKELATARAPPVTLALQKGTMPFFGNEPLGVHP
jgi:hypothetical protein